MEACRPAGSPHCMSILHNRVHIMQMTVRPCNFLVYPSGSQPRQLSWLDANASAMKVVMEGTCMKQDVAP